jgi:hypothetical protein
MQKLFPQKVGILDYHFGVHKNVTISYCYILLSVHHRWNNILVLFNYCTPWKYFPMVSRVTQKEIVCKSYAHGKLTYQFTTSRFTKFLVFHILGWCLQETIDKFMGYIILTILLLGETLQWPLEWKKWGSYTKFKPQGSWCTNLPLRHSQIYWHFI